MKFCRKHVLRKGAISICCLLLGLIGSSCDNQSKEYGVFLGLNHDQVVKLKQYRTIVIEPEEVEAVDITAFHQRGQLVYGYLNIGALETYRYYYRDFKQYGLAPYEGWSDEVWMDVSKKPWQDYISRQLAQRIKDKGFDGFFIDNTDVYYHYQTDAIYQGLVQILKQLKGYQMNIIVNGGDSFITRVLMEGKNTSIFDGVNQESVFTTSSQTETDYFKEYLKTVREKHKQVYVLEYGASEEEKLRIQTYCHQNGYHYFIAENQDLKEEQN